jgi:hypothetical protein
VFTPIKYVARNLFLVLLATFTLITIIAKGMN